MSKDTKKQDEGEALYNAMMSAARQVYATVAPIVPWSDLPKKERDVYAQCVRNLTPKTYDPFDL